MTEVKEWKWQAIDMAEEGNMSWREIARVLDVPKSTLSDMLRKYFASKEDVKQVEYKGPKILFLDIETFAMTLTGWGLFNQNFSIDQIKEDWSILSFCSKFAHSSEITYMACDEFSEKEMLQKLWELFNEADYVCGHNSKKFDVRKIFSRMILQGMDRPSPFRQIDTLEIVRRNFGMSSNKLAYLTSKLCTEHVKSDHGKFAGYNLWKACAEGNKEAFEELRHYNILDVLSLEELYHVLSKWDTKLPVFEVHEDHVSDMSNWVECGYVYSNVGKYQCYRNKVTKQYRRGRVNLLSKEKRDSLLANII